VTEPPEPPARVRELAERRAQARQSRNFAAADQLRAQLGELGWSVTDGPGGYELVPARPAATVPAATLPAATLPAAGGSAAGGSAAGGSATGLPAYRVWPDPAAVPTASGAGPGRRATVALLVEGWPDDLRACVAALLAYGPTGVVISGLDVGNRDGAGDVLHELAVAHPGRVEEWHVAASPGWGASRNALLGADPAPVHVIMETSTILTGDAIGPLLAAVTADGVVAAGWRGVDPDPDLRGFHDAGPGPVRALLGYLLAVRADAARAVGGLPAGARFYRNADLEFSLRLGRSGRLLVPAEPLPVRQGRHRGYHDSDPDYRDRESRRNYRRVLDLLRADSG
jgi:hypothetical protein